ncbi:hypothetical protein D3C77_356300 [compost metagenome]
MNFKDALQAQHRELDGEPVPDGKPHQFHAFGDQPGQNSGWYLLFPDGDGCWGSPHPHRSGVWHASNLGATPLSAAANG